MKKSAFLSISDFAKYSRTTRDTLLHYDNIGLLSPVFRGSNNYRYYSITQVGIMNMIRTMQELGMSLEEIKEIKDNRNPQNIEHLLLEHMDIIDTKINEWQKAKKLLSNTVKDIQSAQSIDKNMICVKYLSAETIVLGDVNDYSGGKDDYDALVDFYRKIFEKYPKLDMNYPVWGVFSKERLLKRDYKWPDRYYMCNPDGADKKPASRYVVGYSRGGYGQSDELFERLLDFIDKNNLVINGDSYKEYPLNEMCVVDDRNYLIRVMIAVSEKHNEDVQKK